MNIKYLTAAFGCLAFPIGALAGPTERASDSSTLTNIFAILPFLILAVILFWFFRRVQSGPKAKQTETYIIRHEQHMERVERSLERIAIALEGKDKDAA